MTPSKKFFQLWCYYEREDLWKMEGFYRTVGDADARGKQLRDNVDTPCMPDWLILEVEGWW